MLANHLEHEGWRILSVADTATRQRGVDLDCERDGQRLMIEVKGYPSTGYRDPRRAGERKRTNPTLQARHWFAGALLTALRLRHRHPEAAVGLAFPDFPRYQTLLEETGAFLQKAGIVVYIVCEDGYIAGPEV